MDLELVRWLLLAHLERCSRVEVFAGHEARSLRALREILAVDDELVARVLAIAQRHGGSGGGSGILQAAPEE